LQVGIGLAGLGLQAGQLFAALGQAAADQHHLLQLRQVGLPGIGQARQVLAVGQRGVDLRQLLHAALLVVFQLLQLLLAVSDLLLRLLADAALGGQLLVQAGQVVLGGEGLAQARGVIAVLGLAVGQRLARSFQRLLEFAGAHLQFGLLRCCSAIAAASGASCALRSCWRWNW
jgi:hypothetical protein